MFPHGSGYAPLPLLLLILSFSPAFGQSTQVNLYGGLPTTSTTKLLFYDGAGNIQYLCVANSVQAATTFPIASATTASEAVFTVTAGHKIYYSATGSMSPQATITGATGTWAPVNGRWILVPQSDTTFKLYSLAGVVLDSSGFTTGGVSASTASTTAPRIDQPVWGMMRFLYDATPNLTQVQAAWNGGMRSVCADRAAATVPWN